MYLKNYRIFISHSWSYKDKYDSLIKMLDSALFFNYTNYSVPKDDPIHSCGTDKELYEAIKNQIMPCNIVLILAGVYATYSKWINKEIYICKNEFLSPKPIIGVRQWDAEKISSVVSENADDIVGWNTASIVSAIRRLAI